MAYRLIHVSIYERHMSLAMQEQIDGDNLLARNLEVLRERDLEFGAIILSGYMQDTSP